METETKVILNFEVSEQTRRAFKMAAAEAGKTFGEFLAVLLAERATAATERKESA